MKTRTLKYAVSYLICLFLTATVWTQTTEFVYQGQLENASFPATGNHDFEFLLYDQLSGGTQVGSTLTRSSIAVTNGVFSVTLDFGSGAVPGSNRYLEIHVRQTGGGSFTTLAPRQQILSTPYSIRTLSAAFADGISAACNGCVQDSHINSLSGSKVTGAIPVAGLPAGSANYIQNTTSQQSSSNFNVSGSGTVGSLTTSGAATFGGIAPPANAPAGQGRMYFDTASSKFRVSQNGNAFVDLVGSGGVSGSGNTNSIPFWSANTTLGSSVMSQSGSFIGIGTTTPGAGLEVRGTSFSAGQRLTDNASGNSLVLQSGAGVNLKVTGYNYNTSTAVPLYLSVDGANTFLNTGGGNVTIGNATAAHKLAVIGGPCWTGDCWFGSMELDNSTAIGWRPNIGGTKFGMGHTNDGFYMFRTAADLGTMSANPIYDFRIDNGGNVGIGSMAFNNDLSQARLNIFNVSLGYGFLNTLGAVSAGSYVSATGGAYGTRSNHPLQFFTNDNAGSPQMTIATNGNVGIGTTTPSAKLQVAGGSSAGISVSSQGNALVGTSSGGGFASVFGENTNPISGGFGVYGKGTSAGYALYAEGNAGQSRDKGGMVKAMAYVTDTGSISRCYNSANVSPLIANCGFSVSHPSTGTYIINFGFMVSDRFVITEGHGFDSNHYYGAGLGNPNAIGVSIVDFTNTLREAPFTIIVF